ncbi:MAG TPA: OB-fold domain-containing protein [Tepidiformaceae bacterium]|nr:OB-fold domain-containing protein [Tepidiformaceae bacterium]
MTSNTLTTEKTSYLPEGLPMPAASPDGLDQRFWDATKQHELMVQRCASCQTFQFGPEWLCHKCHSFDLEWHKVSGRGRIYSWERVWHPVHPALKGACPYLVVLVELPDAGNVRMVGNLLGDPMQDIVIGSEVQVEFEDHPEAGIALVQWRVVE